jgi:hypothetical protein
MIMLRACAATATRPPARVRDAPRERAAGSRAQPPGRQRGAEQRPAQQPRRSAMRARLSSGGADLRVDDLAADVDEMPVAHARRAGRLAAAAREAAIEVQLRLRGRRRAFEHLLDQVDAPARAVELVAEQLVGRARRRAEAAMHARAQDRVGLAAFRACRDERRERGLHQSSGTCARD